MNDEWLIIKNKYNNKIKKVVNKGATLIKSTS